MAKAKSIPIAIGTKASAKKSFFNTISACYGAAIGGGYCNTIDGGDASGSYSFIGGGYCNIINGGDSPGSYSFIGSGCHNTVSAYYSSVLGGCANNASGAYSSILGGSGNTISAAYQYAGVFGCNINALYSCALHANRLVSTNTPIYAGLPQILQYFPAPSGLGFPAGSCIILIS